MPGMVYFVDWTTVVSYPINSQNCARRKSDEKTFQQLLMCVYKFQALCDVFSVKMIHACSASHSTNIKTYNKEITAPS